MVYLLIYESTDEIRVTIYSDKGDSNLFVTKEGKNRRTIQNIRVDGSGNTKKSPKMYFSFKCLNELVPPYLSDYFIRNRTINTYKTRQDKATTLS